MLAGTWHIWEGPLWVIFTEDSCSRDMISGKGFSKMLDGISGLFKAKEKKAPLKTVYRKQKTTVSSSVNYDKELHQRKIDAILDKISKSGYESLSKTEKDFLFKAGKED